jgi:hypothetical protein
VCVCVCVAFIIQHALRMRRVTLSSVARRTVPYFSILSHKRHDFREKGIEHKMCVLMFSTTLFCNISHSKKNCVRYYHKCQYVFRYSRHYTLFLSDFKWTWIFSTHFRNKVEYQISWKSVQGEPSSSMRTDGERHDEINSRLSQLCERAYKRHANTTPLICSCIVRAPFCVFLTETNQ